MTERGPMTRERFAQLLDAYGARPERWPADERAAALALLAADQDAQRLQRDAAALDSLLDRAPALEPSAELRRAVAEIPLRAPREVALPWWFATFARGALSAVLVLALGVLAGVATSGDDDSAAGTAVSAVDEEGQADDAVDELVELAFAGAFYEEAQP